MTLVKNWNFPLWLVFNKIGLEIMFANHPVRKQAYLDWKKKFYQVALRRYFLKGLTHDFCKKLKFFLCLLFNKIGLKKKFADHLVTKQAYLDWKIKILPSRLTQIFFKGVNPWFWSKIEIFFFVYFSTK